MQKKRKRGKKIQKKIGYKKKNTRGGGQPVSDNRKRLKEKEPMKKKTRQERAPRYLKF